MVVVELDVKEQLAIRAHSTTAAVVSLDDIVEIARHRSVAHAMEKLVRALIVWRSTPAARSGECRLRELEIFVVLGQRVAIEHDFWPRRRRARHAAEQFMLPALAKPAEIRRKHHPARRRWNRPP